MSGRRLCGGNDFIFGREWVGGEMGVVGVSHSLLSGLRDGMGN